METKRDGSASRFVTQMVSFVPAATIAKDRAKDDNVRLRGSAIVDSDVSGEDEEDETEEDETEDDDEDEEDDDHARGRGSTDLRSTMNTAPALSIQFATTHQAPSQERKSLQKMINQAHARSHSYDDSNSRQSSRNRRNEREMRQRRSNPSPPPPPAFVNRVSFETFEGAADAQPFSLTLKSKHKDYTYSRYSRTFLCGLDTNDYSHNALEWLMEILAEEGDEIVVLRVLDPGSRVSSEASRDDGGYLHEAKMLLDSVLKINEDGKAVNVALSKDQTDARLDCYCGGTGDG